MTQNKGSAKCKWLTEDSRSRVGYYCGYHFPCPYIDADVTCKCPCFKYALAFEAASRSAPPPTTTTTTTYSGSGAYSLTHNKGDIDEN